MAAVTASVVGMNSHLDVGNVISRVFKIYGDQFAVLFLSALVINLVQVVALAGGLLSVILGSLLSLIANVFYTGMVVRLVEDLQDGRRDASVGQLFESVAPVVLPLIGAGILAGIGIAIGFLLLIIPGVILLTIWAVVAPVIVVERSGVINSFGRSLELVRPNFWQTLGVIAVMTVISFVASAILGGIGAGIGDDVGGVLFRIVAGALTAPLVALAAAVIYFELRGTEGGGAAAGAGAVGGAVATPGAPPPAASPAAPAPPAQAPPADPPPPPPPASPPAH